MLSLDETVRKLSGNSVVRALYLDGHGKGAVFDRTLLTHPAIFMVEYSLVQVLIRGGVTPDVIVGASLGTFAAAAIAGLLKVEDGLHAVLHQAATLEAHCEPGGMLAVLADPKLFAEDFLATRSELAAVNFSTHFVVAAPHAELIRIEADLRLRGVTFQRLPVSFAFHSRWIDPAQQPFDSVARAIQSRKGSIPLVCGGESAPLMELPASYFWRVIRQPIRFQEAIAQLERAGAHHYIDVGPAGTLATFLKYGLPASSRSTIHSILTPFGQEQKSLATVLALGKSFRQRR
jgi:bacillaene synthase trans-acting acyltransferase